MEKAKVIIKNIVSINSDKTFFYKRNLIKECLQVFVLDYIYSHKKYNSLIFYGGSCLSQCYSLPRLSEDLDFVDISKNIKIEKLAKDLKDFFENKTDLEVDVKVQKFRIYLKFSILKELGLTSTRDESDMLYLKVEVFSGFDFCKKYKEEIRPLFKYNKSVLVRIFDLPTLMSIKIRAVLKRRWEKTDKKGNVLIQVKGRDFFDLMWYLERGIKPSFDCLEDIKTNNELRKKLLNSIEKIDYRSIVLDLENFVDDENFVKNLGKNIKDILKRNILKL